MIGSNKLQILLQIVIILLLVLFLSTLASHVYSDTFRFRDASLAFLPIWITEGVLFAIINLLHTPKIKVALLVLTAMLCFIVTWFHDLEIEPIYLLFLILLNYLIFIARKSTKLLTLILFLIILVFFILILNLRFTPGGVSLGSYIKCYKSIATYNYIDDKFAYRATSKNICITRHTCNAFKKGFACEDNEDDDKWLNGLVAIKNVDPNTFKIQKYKMCEKNKYMHYWIVDMNNRSYFMTLDKGNGRFFEVDKDSFQYLGRDLYKDEYGYVYKNTRVH